MEDYSKMTTKTSIKYPPTATFVRKKRMKNRTVTSTANSKLCRNSLYALPHKNFLLKVAADVNSQKTNANENLLLYIRTNLNHNKNK